MAALGWVLPGYHTADFSRAPYCSPRGGITQPPGQPAILQLSSRCLLAALAALMASSAGRWDWRVGRAGSLTDTHAPSFNAAAALFKSFATALFKPAKESFWNSCC